MKVLITGASGFIGQHTVAEILGRGHQVIALVRALPPPAWRGMRNLEILESDLRRIKPAALVAREIDSIVHLAAATKGTFDQQMEDTVTGTGNLLHAARLAGVPNLVGISSIAVLDYRSVEPMGLIDERVALVNGSDVGVYTAVKLQQELLFEGYATEGASCGILRPGLVYDESRLIAAHAGVLKGRLRLLVSHGGEVPTIEVCGLARAIANAAERLGAGCERIHLVDDHLPTQNQYLAGLRRRDLLAAGGVVISWRVFAALSGTLGNMITAIKLGAKAPEALLPKGFAARLKPFKFSNAKAKGLLGWIPGRAFS